MNTFERVEDLLINAADVHRKAVDLYKSLRENSSNSRVGYLLDSMIEQDQRLETNIVTFVDRSGPGILETRLQYTLEMDSDAYIDSLAPAARNLELSDVNRLGQQVHDYVVDLLEGAKRETASQEVQQLLDNVLTLEVAERQNFAKRADAIYDV